MGCVNKDRSILLGNQVNPAKAIDKGHELKKAEKKVTLVDGSKAYVIRIKQSQNTKPLFINLEKQKKKQPIISPKYKYVNMNSHRVCWHCGHFGHLRRNCKSLEQTKKRNYYYFLKLEKNKNQPFITTENKDVSMKSQRIRWHWGI